MPLFIDYETASLVDLKKAGHYAYARDKSTRVLMLAFAEDEGIPHVAASLAQTEEEGIWDPSVWCIHWAPFDHEIARHVEGITIKSLDAQAVALSLGLPARLDHCAKMLGLEARKDPQGTRLINRYSKPNKAGELTPLERNSEDYVRFASYAATDVAVLQGVWQQISRYLLHWRDHAFENYELVRRMNERGVPIDLESCRRAVTLLDWEENKLSAECVDLCGYRPTQVKQLAEFLELPNLRKETLEPVYTGTIEQQRVREIRLTVAKASTKKLAAMVAMSEADGVARGCFKANGAHTGRLTSSGIQLQNMKRGTPPEDFFARLSTRTPFEGNAHEQIAEATRGFIKAPVGSTFLQADYSQIEARILAWAAGQNDLVEDFRAGHDVYKQMASVLFNVPLERIDDKQRSVGKFAVLACGYQLGGIGMEKQAASYGLHELVGNEDACWQIVGAYRDRFPKIVRFWYDVQDAFGATLYDRQPHTAGPLRFSWIDSTYMVMRLPSGRQVFYRNPRRVTDNSTEFTGYGGRGESIGYDGSRFGSFEPTYTYGGKLVENAVQAMAADVMLHGWANVEALGFEPILSVHDEIVSLIPDDEANQETERIYRQAMCEVPRWAEHIPIVADSWVAERFKK